MITYPTPAQVSIHLNDFWVDDAFRIEFREQAAKVPLRGWDETRFSAVAESPVIVTGNLTINYRYPKYLLTALENTASRNTIRNRAKETADDISRATVEQRIDMLEHARQTGTLDIVGATYSKMFLPHGLAIDADASVLIWDAVDLSTKIKIYFDDESRALYHRELYGVVFTGRAMTAGAGVGGGDVSSSGMPLYEIYSFFAQGVRDVPSKNKRRPVPDGVTVLPEE